MSTRSERFFRLSLIPCVLQVGAPRILPIMPMVSMYMNTSGCKKKWEELLKGQEDKVFSIVVGIFRLIRAR